MKCHGLYYIQKMLTGNIMKVITLIRLYQILNEECNFVVFKGTMYLQPIVKTFVKKLWLQVFIKLLSWKNTHVFMMKVTSAVHSSNLCWLKSSR